VKKKDAKTGSVPGETEGARRATGDSPGDGDNSRLGRSGRFSSKRKREVVVRLLRGENLEMLSRALGITAATLSHWRNAFLAAGEAAMKSREPDARDEEIKRFKAKIGELTMENELLYEKIKRMEEKHPFVPRRWRR